MGCAPTSHLHRIGSFALAGPGRQAAHAHGGKCSARALDAAQEYLLQCCCAAMSYLACAPTSCTPQSKCSLLLWPEAGTPTRLAWVGNYWWAGVPHT